MTEAIDNVVYLKSLYQAFANGDVPTVLAAMDEDIEWNEAEGNPHNLDHPFVGSSAVVEGVFARIANDIDGFEIRPERFIAPGGHRRDVGSLLRSEGARHWGSLSMCKPYMSGISRTARSFAFSSTSTP
jgi:ketosteroid isomerase-like protein